MTRKQVVKRDIARDYFISQLQKKFVTIDIKKEDNDNNFP